MESSQLSQTLVVTSPEQLELFNPIENKKEIRVDNTFARSLYLIDEQFEEDSVLIKSLIIFFHNEIQNNIFGVSSFDVSRFAKQMGYLPDNLNAMHPNPVQLRGKTKAEIDIMKAKEIADPVQFKIWDSNLENALYVLSTNTVNVKYGKTVVDDGDFSMVTGLSGQRYLKSIQMTLKKTKNVTKKVYMYELDPDFVQKTLSLYSYIDLSKIALFQKRRLDNLYLFVSSNIASILHEAKLQGIQKGDGYIEQDFILYFNMAKRLLGTNCKLEKENKRAIKKKLDEFNLLLTEDDFKIEPEWMKGENNMTYYQINLHLKIPKSRIKTDKEEQEDKTRMMNEVSFFNLFHILFKLTNSQAYYTSTMVDKVLAFNDWLKDDTKDYEDKLDMIKTSNKQVYGTVEKPSFVSEKQIYQRALKGLQEVNIINNAFKGNLVQLEEKNK